ncbi:MAG: L-histidine N(alpha)-methyltransferase [Hyphomicrobiaceae bacterium]|nr:L-histidine N(alpha)-methyltransferase [Hyphomicrobiaceae bacterium]
MSSIVSEIETQLHTGEFAEAVLAGLAQSRKSIPCRFLYDARGSELFEEITRLEEYYPTRTEIGLLKDHGAEIAERAGAGCAVVEFGSGSSRKTHILLEALTQASAYVPIDIDDAVLKEATSRLGADFPHLALYPVHADFSQDIRLPEEIEDTPKLGFFPGSTIGNFDLDSAVDFLADAGDLLGPKSDLLIGADLQKDTDILIPAYDDASGVTAEFTLNLLRRINRELDANFDVPRFAHRAVYNDDVGRIEIYIESLADQKVSVLGRPFTFKNGEDIHVENSHKFTVPQFKALAQDAGWETEQVWVDENDLFSMHYLTRP